jgi:hypothetical protein
VTGAAVNTVSAMAQTGEPPAPGTRTAWTVGVVLTILLSGCLSLVAFMAFYLSAFCGDGGPEGLPRCLTAFWGLTACCLATAAIPSIFAPWARRATTSGQIWRRLALCATGYLLPLAWFQGMLRWFFT